MNQFEYNEPNTRERMAARRRTRSNRPAQAVTPGPRRAAGDWLASGRFFSLLLLLASLGCLLYIATAPRFTVQDIHVEGAQALNAQAVANMAAARGQSIWFVDTRQISERLKANAYIERAGIFVMLPDQLAITVEERRPELRWRSGGALYLLDADGRVLSADASAPLTNTLVIDDRTNRQLEPNDTVDPVALKLGRALALRLPAEVAIQPASIGWDGDNGMIVTTLDQRTIIFGLSEDIDNKLTILGALLKDGTPFTVLDLRPNTPYYRNDGPNQPAPAEPTPEPDQ
ncbi:MAG TPA: FtsQ-type POTRA domain-containing protein [Roseiflexaceae bacterium]|nr:FtsQ-type POTRA domain-containing protein [Roseiflexaceae bacterium]